MVKNQHFLLCTLLIGNSLAMEVCETSFTLGSKIVISNSRTNYMDYFVLISQSLPIFLDKLVPPWAAILISVTLILMFGEVLLISKTIVTMLTFFLMLIFVTLIPCLCSFTTDTTSSNLYTLWIDCWGNHGSISPPSSVDFLPRCLSNQ